jgi:hypothetical protein
MFETCAGVRQPWQRGTKDGVVEKMEEVKEKWRWRKKGIMLGLFFLL